ncbi:MAG: hypothetical protein AAGA48_05090 [Myxococcota bacterium]
MNWTGPALALAERILAFMEASLKGEVPEPFEALALDIHAFQTERAPVVAALRPDRVDHWTQIPAVPVGLFKDLPVGTLQADEPATVFRTSGTTGGGRGVHRIRSTALYDQGALAWARRCVPGAPARIVALLDDARQVPDASLSHMVAQFGEATWTVDNGVLDVAATQQATLGEAVFVTTTAFAMAEYLDSGPPPLPPGSVVMVTGGFKGRVHRLEGASLYRAIRERLAPARLVTEYGMTELSSQLWGTPQTAYAPPPWLKVLAVNPVTGEVLPAGTEGQLRFVDLANLDSTIGIETMDAGVVRPDGTVELRGRLAGAPSRGCSLTVEEAWGRASNA